MTSFPSDVIDRCLRVATSTWSDALDRLGAPGVIDGLALRSGAGRVAGMALTVKETAASLHDYPTDAFAVGRFLDVLPAGAILAIEMNGAPVSTFGGLAAQAAVQRGAAGVLIDGACRDLDDIKASGLWLRSRHVTPLSGKGRVHVEAINVRVTLCGVSIDPGDCIIGDDTGVVRVPGQRLHEALVIAEELTARDVRFSEALRGGEAFGEIAARLRHM